MRFNQLAKCLSSYFFILFFFGAFGTEAQQVSNQLTKDQIIDKYLKKGAWKHLIFEPEWQLYIDSAIALNPSIGYLYQQKAMPYFKQGKYEIAMPILDEAVKLDSMAFLDYRAFMKCIFVKRYRDAIHDFESSIILKGEDGYVMDHSYEFYIGVSYMQLNEFENAIHHLNRSIKARQMDGDKWVHHLDLLYMGIAHQEIQQYEKAIYYFDWALRNYEGFSDAEYYKVLSLLRLSQKEAAIELFKKAEIDFKAGRTISEGNSRYEVYPYQINEMHFAALKN